MKSSEFVCRLACEEIVSLPKVMGLWHLVGTVFYSVRFHRQEGFLYTDNILDRKCRQALRHRVLCFISWYDQRVNWGFSGFLRCYCSPLVPCVCF